MVNLVTGASGFVGGHLVDYLLANGNSVRALVRNTSQAESLRQMGVQSLVGEMSEPDVLRQAVRGVSTVFHCAAANSLCTDDEIRRTNLDGVRNLLHAVRDEKAGRVVLMSSLNVFGFSSYDGVTEDSATVRSGEVHVDVKIDGEELALQFARHHDVDVTILRPGLIYGPGERHMPKLAAAVCRGQFVYLGSRHNLVPLIFVSDMVRVMEKAARSRLALCRVFNVADGSRTTIGDLVDTIARLTGARPPKRVIPYFMPRVACTLFAMAGRPGPISRTALRFLGTSRHVSIHRAQTELGFDPAVGLQQGLGETASWLNKSLAETSGLPRAA